MSFADRSRRGEEFKQQLQVWFRQQGYKCEPYGQETKLSEEYLRSLRDCGRDETAMHQRYAPDLMLTLFRSSYYVEAKAGTGVDAHGNEYSAFTYEADSCLVCKQRYAHGDKSFVVFGDWTAAWIHKLWFRELVIPSNRYSEREMQALSDIYRRHFPDVRISYRPASPVGSGTPFVRVSRDLFVPLEQFVADLACRATESPKVEARPLQQGYLWE